MFLCASFKVVSKGQKSRDRNTVLFFGRFYTRGCIIRLDELGQTFVVRLVIRL